MQEWAVLALMMNTAAVNSLVVDFVYVTEFFFVVSEGLGIVLDRLCPSKCI